jgi:hypothetical protein
MATDIYVEDVDVICCYNALKMFMLYVSIMICWHVCVINMCDGLYSYDYYVGVACNII